MGTPAYDDTLGQNYILTHSAASRRKTGSTYTPPEIVEHMVHLASTSSNPDIVVDCGCGSGRFAIACAMAFPSAKIYAVDSSREACEMTKRAARENGVTEAVTVVEADFMDFKLPDDRGRVLWIGNPPYIRHHDISASGKRKFKAVAEDLGIECSLLAGMHIHFLAQIASQWHDGDYGVLVTSAEWLDVNYGAFARRLLTERIGLCELELYGKSERVFEDAMTTAAIIAFGDRRTAVKLTSPSGGHRTVAVDQLSACDKWSRLMTTPAHSEESNLVPLGRFARVHRGVVTGNNRFWVRSPQALQGVPDELTIPVVAHAREIMDECIAQNSPDTLNRLIVLPEDLSGLTGESRRFAEAIVEEGLALGVDKGYVASRRRAWWAIRPPEPPTIMMTYMARRPPIFVENRTRVAMLNVVHGIYPKQPLPEGVAEELVEYLNGNVSTDAGRTYCGGLTKFEPREAETIAVPSTLMEGIR